MFKAAGGRKSPRPSSTGYGRGLAVCRCRLTPRSLKFLECLETARMERPFIGLVRRPPEGKRCRDVTPVIVTSVTSHVRSSSNLSHCYLAMAPKNTVAKQQTSAPANAVESLWKAYSDTTSKRLKLIDSFLVFLMLSGVIQFLYCILVTNFPFNAFLAG